MFRASCYTRAVVHVVDTRAANEAHYVLATGLPGHYHVITETCRPGGEVTTAAEVYTADEVCEAFGVRTYELVRDNLGRRA